MVTRIGGLASGMDIDSIVEKLMSAEKAPLNKLYQQQQKYEWERDAYREINTALSSFDDYLFDNYRLSSNFYKKTVASSNSNLVTATATSAASGSLSIEAVSQLASSARVVGNTINATASKKLSELGITDKSVKINAIQANGKLLPEGVTISIDENETVDSFLKKINNSNAGITAIFENNKISFTAKNTGNNVAGGEIIVESGANVFNKLLNSTSYTDGSALASNGKNAIFTINGISTEKSSNSFSLNGYNVTLHETFNSEQSLGQSFVAASENKANSDTNYHNMLDENYDGSLANKYLGTDYAGTNAYVDLNDFFDAEYETRKDNVNQAKTNLINAQNSLILSTT
ncbi:flagellar hook protein, partial [Butyricicoccus sp. 1XD8-22]